MDGAGLLNMLKITTGTQNSDIPDSTYELALSQSHTKIVEKIKAKIDSKLFYSEFTADLEIGVKDYNNLPITTASAVWVKYSATGDYKKADIKDITELDKSLEDLEANQSQTDPIFMIADNSIFLYPVADEDVTDGIQIRGKMKIPRITVTSPEGAIFDGKLSEYHELIVYGAEEMIHRVNKDKTSAVESDKSYREKLEDMITEISSRYDQPVNYKEPDFTEFTQSSGVLNPFNN